MEPCVDAPRRIAFVVCEKVKAELDRLVNMGVIVSQEQPTSWVNSMNPVKDKWKIPGLIKS